MNAWLKAGLVEMRADADPTKRWMSCWLEVVANPGDVVSDLVERCLPQYRMMCFAITSDIQTVEGSGASAMEEIRRIESGECEKIEADGNAWVTHITRDKVWFEGLYSQGTGGAVSLAQYKLAVQTYLRFLADPEAKPITVPFPQV